MTVVDVSEAVYIRLSAWLYLLQTWCSLRFDDHRGLEPASLRNAEESLSRVLSRSKTHPSPGPNNSSARRAELSYDGALAAKARLHRALISKGRELLIPELCSFWTPHSPQAFMSTCCAALGVDKNERDYLGRWTKTKSDRYVQISRLVVQKLQLLVVSTQADSFTVIEDFLKPREVPQDLISQQLFRLTKTSVQRAPKAVGFYAFTAEEGSLRMLSEDLAFTVPQDPADREIPTPKKQPGRAACATIKKQRAQALEELPRGFYVCIAGRRKIRRLHLLRSCWMVPGVDFFVYAFVPSCRNRESTTRFGRSAASQRVRQTRATSQKRILPQTLRDFEVELSFFPAALMELRLFLSSLSLSVSFFSVLFPFSRRARRRIWQSGSSVWIGRSLLVFAKGEYDESGSPVLGYGLEAILSHRKGSTTNLTDLRYGLEAILSLQRASTTNLTAFRCGFEDLFLSFRKASKMNLTVIRYGLKDLLL